MYNVNGFSALVHRNIKVIGSTYKDAVINSMVLATLWALLGKYLLPAAGLNPAIAGPMFLGSLIFNFTEVTFNRGLGFVFDIAGERTLDFYATLPLSRCWFLLAHVISLSLEIIALSLPGLLIGKCILGTLLTTTTATLPLLIVMYVLSVLFFAVLTLALGLIATQQWFLECVFPQCLVPLMFLGCMDVPWPFISTTFPHLQWLFLLSPITYIIEGLRYTFLGHQTIAIGICLTITSAYILILFGITAYVMKRRHDYL